MASKLTRVGVSQICDVLHLNNLWDFLNDLCLIFSMVIVCNGEIITRLSMEKVTSS